MFEKKDEDIEEVKERDKIVLKMILKGELARRLDYIRKHYGLARFTETIRVLITVEHERLKPLSN